MKNLLEAIRTFERLDITDALYTIEDLIILDNEDLLKGTATLFAYRNELLSPYNFNAIQIGSNTVNLCQRKSRESETCLPLLKLLLNAACNKNNIKLSPEALDKGTALLNTFWNSTMQVIDGAVIERVAHCLNSPLGLQLTPNKFYAEAMKDPTIHPLSKDQLTYHCSITHPLETLLNNTSATNIKFNYRAALIKEISRLKSLPNKELGPLQQLFMLSFGNEAELPAAISKTFKLRTVEPSLLIAVKEVKSILTNSITFNSLINPADIKVNLEEEHLFQITSKLNVNRLATYSPKLPNIDLF